MRLPMLVLSFLTSEVLGPSECFDVKCVPSKTLPITTCIPTIMLYDVQILNKRRDTHVHCGRMLCMPNTFSSAYRTPGRHWQVFNRTPFLQASHKHAAPATSAPHEPPSSPMTSLVCACIAYREEVQVRQDRSKESAAVSCKRDLRNGVGELSFGHRPQVAIAAGDQHQPL